MYRDPPTHQSTPYYIYTPPSLPSSQESSHFSMADEEFDQEEIWGMAKDGSPRGNRRAHYASSSSSSRHTSSTTSRVIIPKTNAEQSGGNQSAPVNVPDWSRIYKDKVGVTEAYSYINSTYDHEEDDEDDGGHNVPPHVWMAKKLARSRISSFSVCEGAGRTLKGRDLSKVRDSVLTRTGFLE